MDKGGLEERVEGQHSKARRDKRGRKPSKTPPSFYCAFGSANDFVIVAEKLGAY